MGNYNPEELAARVTAIVADQLGLAEDQIQLTSRLVEDLGADSLDLVELIMAVEEEFDVEIPDEEFVSSDRTCSYPSTDSDSWHMKTVADCITILARQ